MGFESFRVELRGGSATIHEVSKAIWALERVAVDADSIMMKGSSYFLLRDGNHVIEMELIDSPLTLSCRFTLCHPSSVDSAFLAVVKLLMQATQMRAAICEDVLHEQDYSLGEFADFERAAVGYIAERRREWKAGFGGQVLAATTNEVHERIILPLCQTNVDKAG